MKCSKTIIGLVGPARSGKDTAAQPLIQAGFEPVKLAGGLKAMLSALLQYAGADESRSRSLIESDLKERPCLELLGASPRYAMQTLGQDWARELLRQDFWVALFKVRAQQFPRVVCTDVRYLNEAGAIRELGGTLVRISRPGGPITAPINKICVPSADLAYAAGLIEGEGSFRCINRKPARPLKSGRAPEMAIQISMTDREPLEKIQKILGGRTYGPYHNGVRKSSYYWALQERGTISQVAAALLPHLSPRRQRQAQKLIDADAAHPVGKNAHKPKFHTSETELHQIKCDFEITNDRTVERLHEAITTIISLE